IERVVVHHLLNSLAQPLDVPGDLGAALILVERRLRLTVEQPLLDRRMVLAGLDDVLEAFHRRVGPQPRQVVVDVKLEAQAKQYGGRIRVVFEGGDWSQDRGAQAPELRERLLHAPCPARIGVLGADQLAPPPEPRAARALLVEEPEVAARPPALAGRSDRIS